MAGRGRQDDPRQLTLDGYFVIPEEPAHNPGSLNFDLQLRALLNRAIKESGKQRHAIAAEMSEAMFGDDDDFRVTRAQLDSWTAPSRTDWRFPLAYLPAFVRATCAHWLVDKIAQLCGCRALVGEEALFAEYGRLDAMERAVKAKKDELRRKLPKGTRR